ncbi:MAG: metal-sensing transcriptional repressor [Oscillospiraceae bacterium]|nr:metal-sensing transcriptional repressor [Oscillospiraceae bacterium]
MDEMNKLPQEGMGCCGEKKTQRSEEEYRRLINRLARIEGQIRGIRTMLENNAYCTDVLTQSAAVTAAMNAFNRELISNHIHGCVVRDIRAGDDAVVDELVGIVQKLMK